MKELPILFSAPMVRAILDGTKTQTRRIVKLPLIDRNGTGCEIAGAEINSCLRQGLEICHYGKIGDSLWVKETFFDARKFKQQPLFAAMDLDYIYRADYDYREGQREPSVIGLHHWKPSIFCTRKASRITLEIVSIRGERLNDISESDAIAEGVKMRMAGDVKMFQDYSGPADNVFGPSPILSYKSLWERINGKGSWDQNPWVWVITFKRIKP